MESTIRIIRFTSAFCGPCKTYRHVWNDYMEDYPQYDYLTVDVDNVKSKKLVRDFGIDAWPTTVFMVPETNGIRKREGILTRKEITNEITIAKALGLLYNKQKEQDEFNKEQRESDKGD